MHSQWTRVNKIQHADAFAPLILVTQGSIEAPNFLLHIILCYLLHNMRFHTLWMSKSGRSFETNSSKQLKA
jgi:hypothetical protein